MALQTSHEAYDLLAIVGGDGSIPGVASGLYERKKLGKMPLPLWIVPLGIANVLARELKIPRRLKKILTIFSQKPDHVRFVRHFSKAKRGKSFFFKWQVRVLDAETVANVSYRLKKSLGGIAYLIALLKLLKAPLPLVHIHLKHKNISENFQASCAIFSRGSLYGGPFCIAKNQHPSSKETHLILFQASGKIAFSLSVLGAFLPFPFLKKELFLKKIEPETECHFLGHSAVQADGDLKGKLPALLTCAPFPLTFLH
ncbi:hypothetical protein FAI41_03500 [Acetobacteraceae bacterium]|nr:hypothetical protein FAI41_03500 [Acetobacteraceae bacterium]